ncbi:MAG TPA: iron ABC transporter permease [Candidatus Avacidaminococcus intestinavium]|uniref:Iron ABC transporter permease n=1 Tax=Candidatus Avacidaminococcus intestinavium TaxID=2840684 RepID=A0A9D1SKS9_9FIRM|nr:iron ABC transporter permease [Candidatus Avacidaminococcus intestinavium]
MFTSPKKKKIVLVSLLVALFITAFFSLFSGQIDIPLRNALALLAYQLNIPGISNSDFTQEQLAVVWYIRMPRMLVGLLVGASLGISGAVMQGIFANPLADPGIIGVSSGAAAGAVLSIALGFSAQNMFMMPAFAFCGSLFAVSLTVFLARKNGRIPVMTLLLAGVAVGMLLGAITSGLLTFMNEQKLQQYLFWIIGGLDYRRWEHVYIAIVPVTIGIVTMLALARHLNILVLGDTEAKAVGMPVMFYRMGLLVVAAMTTATSVCVSGNIGFVGLVVPHMMRMLIGPDHRMLLPASAMLGAMFLLLCDALGRVIIPPAEIRVGIMTAVLGSPYFLYLLRKMQKDTL